MKWTGQAIGVYEYDDDVAFSSFGEELVAKHSQMRHTTSQVRLAFGWRYPKAKLQLQLPPRFLDCKIDDVWASSVAASIL